jgi:hypothetical protein
MTLWILFAVMAGAVAGFLLIPLSRRTANRRMLMISMIFVILLLSVGAIALYSFLGSPELPGQPYVSRDFQQ